MSANQFEYIYKNHIEALNSFALKLTRNKMDADDIVQETAIKAFRNFKKFRIEDSFKNWAFTILKNTFITKFNKSKKNSIVNTPVEELQIATDPTMELEPKSSANRKIKFVKKSIENLSTKSKEPFELYISGYAYKEISNYLDIPIGTVKSRINFARTKIKKSFRDIYDYNPRLNRVA